jgi:hypothetical protein
LALEAFFKGFLILMANLLSGASSVVILKKIGVRSDPDFLYSSQRSSSDNNITFKSYYINEILSIAGPSACAMPLGCKDGTFAM